jgi:hypothetical protein
LAQDKPWPSGQYHRNCSSAAHPGAAHDLKDSPPCLAATAGWYSQYLERKGIWRGLAIATVMAMAMAICVWWRRRGSGQSCVLV